jgi:hypothetical protein
MSLVDHPTLDLRPVRKSITALLPVAPVVPVDQQPTRKLEAIGPARLRPAPVLPRFGEWLVRRGVLSRAQLLRVLSTCRLHDWRLGDAVVVMRIASRDRVEAEAGRFDEARGAGDERCCQTLLERLSELERELRAALQARAA